MLNAHQGTPGCWKQALPSPGKVWPPSAEPAGWCNAFSPLFLQDVASEIRVQARSQDTADHKQEVLLDRSHMREHGNALISNAAVSEKSQDMKNLEVWVQGQHLTGKVLGKRNTWLVYSRIQAFSLITLVSFCGSSPKTQFLVIFSGCLWQLGDHRRDDEEVMKNLLWRSVSLLSHTHRPFFNSSFQHWRTVWRCYSWGLFNLDCVRNHSKDKPYQNADVNVAHASTGKELKIKCALLTWTQCDRSWVEQCCETQLFPAHRWKHAAEMAQRRYLESARSGAHPMLRPRKSGDSDVCSSSAFEVGSVMRGEESVRRLSSPRKKINNEEVGIQKNNRGSGKMP